MTTTAAYVIYNPLSNEGYAIDVQLRVIASSNVSRINLQKNTTDLNETGDETVIIKLMGKK